MGEISSVTDQDDAVDNQLEKAWSRSDYETALSQKKFKDALEILKRSKHDQIKDVLRDHELRDLPVWHFFARLRLKDEDLKYLVEILKKYIICGYDINLTTNVYVAQKRASLGFTALHAAIEQSNGVLVDLLLSQGADPNVRDKGGYSPLHWAILVGDLRNLKKLINAGADVNSTPEEQAGVDGVHPILHTAVDEGRTEIVYFLVNEKLVDINEEAIYQSVMTERYLSKFPSRYNCAGLQGADDEENKNAKRTQLMMARLQLELEDVRFSPLARAVRMRKIPIIELLLKDEFNVRFTDGLSELHFCIVEGDTEVACLLMMYYTEEQLANDHIGENWALHSLHLSAFNSEDEVRIQKTKELIQEYIECGWDVNAKSEFVEWKAVEEVPFTCPRTYLRLQNCSLLHIACLNSSPEIVRFLVDAGADVNMQLEIMDEIKVSPLQISILRKDWKSAAYLINGGAQIMAYGYLFDQELTELSLQKLPRPRCDPTALRGGLTEWKCHFNAVQLLLKFGHDESEKILDLMLSKTKISLDELHIALAGGNPKLVLKVLKKLEADLTVGDLANVFVPPNKLPSFSFLISKVVKNFDEPSDVSSHFIALGRVMELFAKFGYNFNWDTDVREDEDLSMTRHIFLVDLKYKTNILLPTILKFDHLKINGAYSGCSIVETVLTTWNKLCCHEGHYCWTHQNDSNYCPKIVKLLVEHGVDVSSLEIRPPLKYHSGYKDMFKLLICMGATINPDFFKEPSCHPGFMATRGFHKEVEELRNWMKSYEAMQPNLQNICRIKLRSMVRSVGDLKSFEELPRRLQKELLGEDFKV